MKLEHWGHCEAWGSHHSDFKIAGMWHSILCAETPGTVTLQGSSFH